MHSEYIQFIILHILYDKFESTGSSQDIRTNEVLGSPDLNYLGSKTISAEIDYLAGQKTPIIIGSSSTGHSPYSWLRISSEGVKIIRDIMKNYPLYLNSIDDQECKQLYTQVAAMQNKTGERLEIYGFIIRKPKYFEDFLIDVLATIPR